MTFDKKGCLNSPLIVLKEGIIKIKSSKINESIFSIIKDRFSMLNIDIEKISEEEFFKILYANETAKRIFEEYEDQLEEDFSSNNSNQINNNNNISNNNINNNFQMFPLKFIKKNANNENENDNEILIYEEEYYFGEFNNEGFFNGIGTYINKRGDIFYGHFINDEFNGKGILIKPNGSSCYSTWEKGLAKGKSIIKVNSKLKYEGDLLYNKKHGHGKEYFPDETIYQGNYDNGEKNGYGKLSLPNGDIYEGNFENNFFEGKGRYEWITEGREYFGEFQKGIITGEGRTKFKDGSIYEGTYLCGMKHGLGCYSWPDGTKFYGNWINNTLHGNGCYLIGEERYDIFFRFGKLISSKKICVGIWESPSDSNEKMNFGIKSIINNNNEINNKEKYICNICKNILTNPQKCTHCNNNYCLDCLKTNESRKSVFCPKCQNSDYENNLYLLNELISKVKIKCDECGMTLDYQSAMEHFHKD